MPHKRSPKAVVAREYKLKMKLRCPKLDAVHSNTTECKRVIIQVPVKVNTFGVKVGLHNEPDYDFGVWMSKHGDWSISRHDNLLKWVEWRRKEGFLT